MCLVGSAESVVEGLRVWKGLGLGLADLIRGSFALRI